MSKINIDSVQGSNINIGENLSNVAQHIGGPMTIKTVTFRFKETSDRGSLEILSTVINTGGVTLTFRVHEGSQIRYIIEKPEDFMVEDDLDLNGNIIGYISHNAPDHE